MTTAKLKQGLHIFAVVALAPNGGQKWLYYVKGAELPMYYDCKRYVRTFKASLPSHATNIRHELKREFHVSDTIFSIYYMLTYSKIA